MKKLYFLFIILLYVNPLKAQTFTEQTGISLTGVADASVAWGDYDNNGYLDILLTGYDGANYVSKIYKNNGDNTFTEQTGISLTGVYYGSATWCDYGNDGDLDILITGHDNSGLIAKIYKNNGSDSFTEQTTISLEGTYFSSQAWADYDNDGDYDILLAGAGGTTGFIAKVYSNNGDGSFTEQTAISLTPISRASVAWADYDNDGAMDILLTGYTGSTYIAEIYKNNGNSNFTQQTAISLTGVDYGSVVWGDYDSDGDLDILLTGYDGANYISKIYKNTGNNTFAELSGISISGVGYSSVAWGDYDNDGDLDILLTGTTATGKVAKIYTNTGNDTFSELAGISLTAVDYSSVAWCDYDKDGDLDILLTGRDTSNNPIAKIYRNDATISNSIPAAPSTLSENITGQNVQLFWSGASDAETLPAGLSYNLRVGTSSQGNDVVSSQAFSTGARKVVQMGNVQQNTSWTLKNLPPGTYYWSVQTVDNNFAGGAWSVQRSFTIAPPPIYSASTALDALPGFQYGDLDWGDADNDGDLDLIVTGQSDWGMKTYLIYNDNNSFTRIDSISFVQASYSSVKWIDYDGDGFMDLWINGVNGSNYYANLYRNLGGGTFTNITVPMQGIYNAAADWGDYDADGDLDLLLVGRTVAGRKAFIYRNDNGTFVETTPGFTAVDYAAAKFGDYDADGDLDVLLTGYDVNYNKNTLLYRNDGNDTWTDVTATEFVNAPEAIYYGDLQWLDYDADGFLDFILTGTNAAGSATLICYRKGGGFYPQQTFSGLKYSSIDIGDYDNDGDLDFLTTGLASDGTTYLTTIFKRDAGVYAASDETIFEGVDYGKAKFGDFDNDGDLDIALMGANNAARKLKLYINTAQQTNNPPAAPTTLISNVTADSVLFTWTAPSDDHTPAVTLGYNIKLGTSSGAQDIIAPFPDKYTTLGNTNVGTFKKIKNLKNGIYYWSVQAVDNGFRAGAWSVEQSFAVGDIPVNSGDSLALVTLYTSTNGSSWNNTTNWLTGNVKNWYGVTVTGNRVTRLNLVGNNLNGYIPAAIGNLTALKYLDLGSNNLPNLLPLEIGNLTNLDTLFIAGSKLVNGIPTSIGNLTNLNVLALDDNQLTGNIPVEIGAITNLKALYLHNNQLSGNVPSELAGLSSLEYLYLNNNQLTDTIPWQIGNLNNLRTLNLSYNNLSGNIPIELSNLSNIQYLFLNNNQLTGAVPFDFNNLTTLISLNLNNNQLDQLNNLSALSSLQYLYIQNNKFDFGDLAATGLNWGNIAYHIYAPQAHLPITKDSTGTGTINLSFTVYGVNNNIEWYKGDVVINGQIDTLISVPDTSNAGFYAQITNLNYPELTLYTKVVELGNAGLTNGIVDAEYYSLIILYDSLGGNSWTNNTNWLTGALVSNWYGVSTAGIHVTGINLAENNLNGTLTSDIGNFPYLLSLYLPRNQITGTIPAAVRKLSSLKIFYLYQNSFTGNLPLELGNMNMEKLDLSDNQFTGTIPATLANNTNLKIIYLNNNQFGGQIPSELGNLTSLQFLYLQNNLLTGDVPASLGLSTNLINCNLSSNNLKTLPVFSSQVLSTDSLQGLIVANNFFSFANLVPNVANLQNQSKYAPQKNIPLLKTDSVPVQNATLTLNMNQLTGKTLTATNNSYLWYKNDVSTGVTTETYTFNNYTLADTGYYYLKMTNSQFPNITIRTQAIHLTDNIVATLPNAPGNFSLSVVSSSQIDLSWSDNSNNEDGFNIYYSTDGTNFSYFVLAGANTTSYPATPLSPSTTYYFKVCAYNSAGESCSSIQSTTTPSDSGTVPQAPTLDAATAISGSQIDLGWTDNSNNEDGFYVYSSADNQNFNLIATLNADIISYSATGLSKNTTYYFYVCAFNSAGTSCSNTLSATTLNSNSPDVTNKTICENGQIPDLYASGTNIKWYSDVYLTNLLASGNSYTTGQTQAGQYIYYVTQTVNGTESEPAAVSLTILPIPEANAGADFKQCVMDISLNANSPTSEETGQWNKIDAYGSFINAQNNQTIFRSDYGGVVKLAWTVTNTNTGCSNTDTVKITIFDKPEAPLIKQKGQSIPNFALFICQTSNVKYQWYRDNQPILGAANQYYIERSNFGSSYGIEITDKNGCANRTDINYVKSSEIKMKIYPIPAKNNAKVSILSENKGKFSLRISDPMGIIFKNKILTKSLVQQEYNIDINSLKPGVYILEVIFDNKVKSAQKLIIQ